MGKGFIIFAVVCISVAVIHVLSLRALKYSEHKKNRIRKVAWYFYSFYFLGYGIYLNIDRGWDLIGIGFILCSLAFMYANFSGQFREKAAGD